MLDVTVTAWAVTVGLILVLLAVDLALAVARPHEVGFREASYTSVFYIAVAIAFGVVFGITAGWDFGGQYFAGYIVEKSLSIDNLFVFVVIITSFAVPREHQQKVLIIGILLALVLRVINPGLPPRPPSGSGPTSGSGRRPPGAAGCCTGE